MEGREVGTTYEYDIQALTDLGASMDAMGQLMGVVICKQHPDRTLSGRHRVKRDAKAIFELDVDERRKSLGVSHEAFEQLATMHFNVQRTVGRDERKQELLTLARQLQAEGIPNDQIAQKAIALTRGVIGRAWVYQLLDAEFKDQAKSRAISQGLKKPYDKGLSELASQHVEKTATPAKVKLLEIVNRAVGPHFRDEEIFDRGEKGKDGKPKFFSVDVALDCGIGLEAEGAGTSSDDPVREKFILEHPSVHGLAVKRLVHLPNKLIEQYPETVELLVRLLYKYGIDDLEWKKEGLS